MTRLPFALSRPLGLAAFLLTAPAAAQVPGLSGTLVVTNKTPSTATIIDVETGRTLETLKTGPGPHEVVISRDGSIAVVTDYGGPGARNTLTVFDVPARKVARVISLGEYRAPHGIVFLPGDSLVAVTSEATRNVVIVHVASGAVRRAIGTNFAGSHMIGVTADGARGYTGNIQANTVSELDLRTGAFVRSFDVPAQPEAINVTPDGKEVWVGSNATGKITVIDVATGAQRTAAEGFGWPYRVLYSPDNRTVTLPDYRGETVRFLDRATHRELARLTLPGAGPQGVATTPDGRYVFLSLSQQSRVAIIDMTTHTIVGYLAAGETPDGVAYAAAPRSSPAR